MRLAAISMAIVFGALVAVAAFAPERALACSIGSGNIESSAEYAQVIIVGVVEDERPLHDLYESYESTIRVAATLKGTTGETITITPTGWLGAACEGNPRLIEGERVLLFLSNFDGRDIAARPSPTPGPLQVAGYENGLWHISSTGTITSEWANPAGLTAEEAIRRTAQLVDAQPAQVAAALAFAGAAQVTAQPTLTAQLAPADTDGGGDASDWVAPVLVGGAAMLLATALGGWMFVRRG